MARRGTRELLQEHIRTVMGSHIVTVGPDDPLDAVAREIADHRIDAVPVVDREHRLLGIVSTTDLVNLLHDGGRLEGKLARDVMSPDPISIDEFARADEAIGVMRNAAIRHLPVTREGRLIGLVTAADLVRHLSERRPDPDIA
jgi:CBS domain-containing protein